MRMATGFLPPGFIIPAPSLRRVVVRFPKGDARVLPVAVEPRLAHHNAHDLSSLGAVGTRRHSGRGDTLPHPHAQTWHGPGPVLSALPRAYWAAPDWRGWPASTWIGQGYVSRLWALKRRNRLEPEGQMELPRSWPSPRPTRLSARSQLRLARRTMTRSAPRDSTRRARCLTRWPPIPRIGTLWAVVAASDVILSVCPARRDGPSPPGRRRAILEPLRRRERRRACGRPRRRRDRRGGRLRVHRRWHDPRGRDPLLLAESERTLSGLGTRSEAAVAPNAPAASAIADVAVPLGAEQNPSLRRHPV